MGERAVFPDLKDKSAVNRDFAGFAGFFSHDVDRCCIRMCPVDVKHPVKSGASES